MALIVEYETRLSMLRKTLEGAPSVTVEHDDIFYTAGRRVRWVFWARGPELPAFDAGLDDDPTVEAARVLTEEDGQSLYSVTLAGEPEDYALWTFTRWDVQVLDTTHDADRTVVVARCPSRAALAAAREAVEERYELFRVRRIYRESTPEDKGYGLTPQQREAMQVALEAGYYEVPRNATLSVVADRLGVSEQAVSSRLRRGTASILRSTLDREQHRDWDQDSDGQERGT